MAFLDDQLPRYLIQRSNTIRHIVFTAFFALVFINIYAPFGVETHFQVSRVELFLYSSLFILCGIAVVALSRLLMYLYFRFRGLRYYEYLLWVAGEILIMALVYTFLSKYILKNPGDFMVMFGHNIRFTALVLLLPYSILWLYFAYREKNLKLSKESSAQLAQDGPSMVAFRDEKGNMKASIKKDLILYLEAADNYVFVHYMDQDKKKKFMIRNSLKNIEKEITGDWLLRSHRSYMVNFNRVKMIRREPNGLHLDLDTPEPISIPVSESYVSQVLAKFSSIT